MQQMGKKTVALDVVAVGVVFRQVSDSARH